MDQNLPRWNQTGWQHRLVLAAHHRQQRRIFECPGTWSGHDLRLRPRTEVAWNLSLHSWAASALPDLVEMALNHGASPTAPLQILESGVEAGKLVEYKKPAPAYFWDNQHHKRLNERVIIKTPIQAALAGGCEDCVNLLIAEAGGLDERTVTELTTWILSMPMDNLSRVEAGTLLIDLLTREGKPYAAAQFRDWLTLAQKFIHRKHRRQGALTKPFTNMLRRLDRVCAILQTELTLPPNLTAQLL